VNKDPEQLLRDVARRVFELRQAIGMTQTELAQRIGSTYQGVQRIERGEQNLTLLTMLKLANALDVPLPALLEPPGSGYPRKRKGAGS
jgi:UDP-N-acetylglucosamine 1-carboxyvinyltransferase